MTERRTNAKDLRWEVLEGQQGVVCGCREEREGSSRGFSGREGPGPGGSCSSLKNCGFYSKQQGKSSEEFEQRRVMI